MTLIRREDALKAATDLAVQNLLRLIDDLRDVTPCWHDHHGFCQAHGWMATDPRCPRWRWRWSRGGAGHTLPARETRDKPSMPPGRVNSPGAAVPAIEAAAAPGSTTTWRTT